MEWTIIIIIIIIMRGKGVSIGNKPQVISGLFETMECAAKGSVTATRCVGPPVRRCRRCEAVAYCSLSHQVFVPLWPFLPINIFIIHHVIRVPVMC